MLAREALGEYFERRGIKPHDESIEAWLSETWAYMTIFGRRVPVKPIYGYKKVLIVHDVHHVVTGYDTSWTGEFEVAAWELGSGGCGRFVLMWNNRLLTLLLGLLFAPAATSRAFARGRKQRNLFRFGWRSVLACDIDELRAYVVGAGRPRQLHAEGAI
jgi:hypothetical protein